MKNYKLKISKQVFSNYDRTVAVEEKLMAYRCELETRANKAHTVTKILRGDRIKTELPDTGALAGLKTIFEEFFDETTNFTIDKILYNPDYVLSDKFVHEALNVYYKHMGFTNETLYKMYRGVPVATLIQEGYLVLDTDALNPEDYTLTKAYEDLEKLYKKESKLLEAPNKRLTNELKKLVEIEAARVSSMSELIAQKRKELLTTKSFINLKQFYPKVKAKTEAKVEAPEQVRLGQLKIEKIIKIKPMSVKTYVFNGMYVCCSKRYGNCTEQCRKKIYYGCAGCDALKPKLHNEALNLKQAAYAAARGHRVVLNLKDVGVIMPRAHKTPYYYNEVDLESVGNYPLWTNFVKACLKRDNKNSFEEFNDIMKNKIITAFNGYVKRFIDVDFSIVQQFNNRLAAVAVEYNLPKDVFYSDNYALNSKVNAIKDVNAYFEELPGYKKENLKNKFSEKENNLIGAYGVHMPLPQYKNTAYYEEGIGFIEDIPTLDFCPNKTHYKQKGKTYDGTAFETEHPMPYAVQKNCTTRDVGVEEDETLYTVRRNTEYKQAWCYNLSMHLDPDPGWGRCYVCGELYRESEGHKCKHNQIAPIVTESYEWLTYNEDQGYDDDEFNEDAFLQRDRVYEDDCSFDD